MAVALRARDGQSQPSASDGVHAINDRLNAKLLRLDAALHVDHGIPEKTGGNALIPRGVRHQVAGELINGELVKRQIAIQRADHPVPIGPDGPGAVLFKAVRIGIPSDIQPVTAPLLAVVRRLQQAFHHLLPGVGGMIGHEGIDVLGCRRKAGQIQADSSNQRDAIGFGGWLKLFGPEAGGHEGIDGIPHPSTIPGLRPGHRGPMHRLKRPVRRGVADRCQGFRPVGTLVDPIFK